MKDDQPSGMRFSPWSYVVKLDENVIGSFVSGSVAYGHWLAAAEKYSGPDDPLCTCTRFRVRLNPYELQQQDITLNFVRAWESIHQSSKSSEL